jgi:hypothetical protein
MVARETNLVNAFETTLAAQLASGGSSMNLSDDPGVDAPAYFVIDPDNDSNREIVLWSSGTNHAAATVTRDVDSKHGTDPTHASGTVVRLAVVKQHIEEAHDAVQQGFVLEDDDGTEVSIAPAVASGVYTAREVKFIGSGITTNWTDVDNGTDGDPYDLTFTLDVNDLDAGTVNQAADSIAILDADDNATKKESVADFVEAINGTGLTASSGVLNVDAAQAITSLTGGDLTIYEDANNADVSLKIGTGAAEALSIEVLNGASNKTAEEIKISTSTASGTANHGKISIYIDGTEIMDIDDGGIDMASGKTVAINGTDLPTTGGKVLQVVTGTTTTDTGAQGTTSYYDTGLTADITPASSSNKVLVIVSQTVQCQRDSDNDMQGHINIMRDSTEVGEWYYAVNEDTGDFGPAVKTLTYLDSPSSTSALTYKTQIKGSTTSNSGSVRANQQLSSGESISSIQLIEIAG